MTRQAFSRTLTKDGSLAKKGKEGEDRGLLQDISAAVNAAVAAQVSPLVSLRGKSLEQLRNTPPLNLPIMQKNSAKSSRLPKPTFHPRSCGSSTASKIWSSGSAPPWQTSTRPRRRWRRRRPWPPTQSTDRRLFRGQCSPTGRLPGRRSRRPTNICRHCQCSSSSRATAASLWAPRSSLTTAEHRRLPTTQERRRSHTSLHWLPCRLRCSSCRNRCSTAAAAAAVAVAGAAAAAAAAVVGGSSRRIGKARVPVLFCNAQSANAAILTENRIHIKRSGAGRAARAANIEDNKLFRPPKACCSP